MEIVKSNCVECNEPFNQEEVMGTISSTCYICKDKALIKAGVPCEDRLLDNINKKKNDPEAILE